MPVGAREIQMPEEHLSNASGRGSLQVPDLTLVINRDLARETENYWLDFGVFPGGLICTFGTSARFNSSLNRPGKHACAKVSARFFHSSSGSFQHELGRLRRLPCSEAWRLVGC